MSTIDLGKPEKVFHAKQNRILTDMALGVLLVLMGALLVLTGNGDGNTVLLLAGVAIVLGGGSIIVMTYLRRFGRQVTLHPNGVTIHIRGRDRQYHYHDLSGVQVEAAERGGDYRVRDYVFYDEKEAVLTVGPIYKGWQLLGDTLLERIATAQVAANVERIRNGFEIVFDEFTEPMLNKGTVIKVNLQGVVQEGKSVLPWERVKTCVLDAHDKGHVDIIDINDTEYAKFRYYNAINSVIAMQTIAQMAALRRA